MIGDVMVVRLMLQSVLTSDLFWSYDQPWLLIGYIGPFCWHSKGSCLGQQIRRFKRCLMIRLMVISHHRAGGIFVFGVWFVCSICWETPILGSSGAVFFFREDTNYCASLCFPGRVLVFCARKLFEYSWVFLTREFEFLTLLFIWVLDFCLILSGGYWWFFGEGIMKSYFEFWVLAICAEICS